MSNIPKGWKLVPEDATDVMLQAMGMHDGYEVREKEVFPYQRYRDYYEAALEVVPPVALPELQERMDGGEPCSQGETDARLNWLETWGQATRGEKAAFIDGFRAVRSTTGAFPLVKRISKQRDDLYDAARAVLSHCDAKPEGETAFEKAVIALRAAAAKVPSYEERLDRIFAFAAEETCPDCKGSGNVTAQQGGGPDAYEIEVQCPKCGGTGALSARGTR